MGFVNRTEWPRREVPYKNPEHLMRLVKVRRTGKGFFAAGRAVQMGEVVTVDQGTAQDLVFLKRAEMVE